MFPWSSEFESASDVDVDVRLVVPVGYMKSRLSSEKNVKKFVGLVCSEALRTKHYFAEERLSSDECRRNREHRRLGLRGGSQPPVVGSPSTQARRPAKMVKRMVVAPFLAPVAVAMRSCVQIVSATTEPSTRSQPLHRLLVVSARILVTSA